MNFDPIDAALRNVSETKALLENLITSSESFDYPKAKAALKELQNKIKSLAKMQAELEGMRGQREANIKVIDFQGTNAANQ